MIPNFALDNTVRKHVETLRESGADGWDVNGARYLEWTERQEYVLCNLISQIVMLTVILGDGGLEQ